MLSSLVALWVVAAPQGVEVVVLPASGDAAQVAKAVRGELTAQGYGGLEAKKGAAEVVTTVERLEKKWLVKLLLRKTKDGAVVAEVRDEAEPESVERVSVEMARELASQLRQAFGVRVRVAPVRKKPKGRRFGRRY